MNTTTNNKTPPPAPTLTAHEDRVINAIVAMLVPTVVARLKANGGADTAIAASSPRAHGAEGRAQ